MSQAFASRPRTVLEPRLQDDVRTLLSPPPGPCVSIYLPARPVGAGDEPARIQLKNLLRQAGERLGATAAEEILAPAYALVDGAPDIDFWRHQEKALALFLAPGFFQYVAIPFPVQERLEVDERFVIRPLLPLLGGGTFYVLALSRKEVRLLEVAGPSIRRVDLEGVPQSLEEALGEQLTGRVFQIHTASPAALGARAAIVHGRGSGEEDVKAELERYLQRVDAGLAPKLPGRKAPLVLAGVEYLLAVYREVSRLHAVTEEGITGSPEHLKDEDLARRARPLAERFFAGSRRRDAERFEHLEGINRTARHITDVLPAARAGRISVLFVSTEADLRGSFGEDGRIHPGNEDLLDLAAFWTLDHGGTVYAVPRDEVPEGADVAAIFRS
jgi:hypothetical protein